MNGRALLLLLGACLGCLGTETGNPPLTGDGATSDALVASFEPNSGLQVQELWVSFAEVRVIDGPLCDRLGPTQTAVGRIANLVDGAALGRLPEGPACGIRIELSPAVTIPADAPPLVSGASLYVRGIDDTARPFELRLSTAETVELDSDAPFEIDGPSTLGFDVAELPVRLDISERAADPDGVVRVSDGDDARLGLMRSAGLYRDVDADGRLSPGEFAAGPLAEHHL